MTLPAGVADILPLTPAQKGMLFHVLEAPSARGRYVAVLSCEISGQLDPERLRQATQTAVQARDAYRAAFVWEGVKEPLQAIREQIDLPWEERDWRDHPDQVQGLRDFITLEQGRSFDLSRAPLMSVVLIRLDEARWQLVWTIHHLISDGWSTSAVLRDILARYHGQMPERAASFKSYVAWLRKSAPPFAPEFWEAEFAGMSGPCILPAPAQAAPQMQHVHLTERFGAPLLREIKALAQTLQVTPHVVLSAAWALTLRKLVGQDDVVYGQTTAGRPPQIPGITKAAGAFINTLPLRVVIDPEASTAEFIQSHGDAQIARAPHEFAALSDVQACAPTPSGTALFDTLFVNEGIAVSDIKGPEISISGVSTIQSSNYALALLVTPQEDFQVELYADPAKVNEAKAEQCVAQYKSYLSAIVSSPKAPLRNLAWHEVDPITLPQPQSFPHVLDRILAHAKTTPEATAISDGSCTWTYAQLAERAIIIAAGLRAEGIGDGDLVPIALPRGAEAIAAFLGVMMVGAAYVPLDLTYPKQRIAQVIEAVAPRVILTASAVSGDVPETSATLIQTDNLAADVTETPPCPGSRAYVIFTSGSQGQPKGVEISHDALAYSTGIRDTVYGDTPSAYLLLSSLAFDSSVAGIYWTLATGGHLVVAPAGVEQQPAQLGALMRTHQITHTLCLPSLAQAMLGAVPHSDLTSLKTLITAGEAVPSALVQDMRAALPRCRVVNEYGPTETTVWCTAHDTTQTPHDGPVPIGRALPGTWVGVVDEDLCPVPPGTVGEIVVAGPMLAKGYLNAAEEGRFVKLGLNGPRAYRTGDLGRMDAVGLITFLGRRDSQVKIRGHRVELADIEIAAQRAAPGVEVAACVIDGPRIALFLEHDEEHALTSWVQSALQDSLPAAFQPHTIKCTAPFPRLPNRKVDRATLAAMVIDDRDDEGTAPKDALEQSLAEIFCSVLRTDDLHRDSHFFDEGGDSLMTIAAYSLARKQGIVFEPVDLFDHPTIASLARHIRSESGKTYSIEDQGIVQFANVDGAKAAAFIVHGTVKLFNQVARGLGAEHPAGMIFGHHFHKHPPPFDQTVEDMAVEALEVLRRLQPNGPYVLSGFSIGCAIVLEMAERLASQEIAAIVLLDPPYDMPGRAPELQSPVDRFIKRPKQMIARSLRRDRLSRKLNRAKARCAREPDNEDYRIGAINLTYVDAIARYQMPRFDGVAHVFVTRGNPSMREGDVLDTHLTQKTVTHSDLSHEDLVQNPDGVLPIAAKIIAACQAASAVKK